MAIPPTPSAGRTGHVLRVAHLASPSVEGGVTGHVIGLAEHLPGWVESTWIVPDLPALRPVVARARGRGVAVHTIGGDGSQVIDRLDDIDADLVHLHFCTPTDLLDALERLQDSDRALVTSDHMVAGGPWGGLSAEACARRRHAAGRVACCLADSRAIAAGLVEVVGLPAARVHVVHHGIDTDRFRPGDRLESRRSLGLPLDRLLIGAVGVLVSAKGVDRVIEACGRARDEATLVVVGDGPERPRLERLARRRGVPLRITGWRQDVEIWLRALDLLVHASETEGFSSVLLEAMASGCPVVAAAVGGVPEVLAGGERGMLVPPGDVQALAHAVAALLADLRSARDAQVSPSSSTLPRERELQTLAERVTRARGAVASLYSIERTAGRVAAVYRSALAAPI